MIEFIETADFYNLETESELKIDVSFAIALNRYDIITIYPDDTAEDHPYFFDLTEEKLKHWQNDLTSCYYIVCAIKFYGGNRMGIEVLELCDKSGNVREIFKHLTFYGNPPY